MPFEVPTREERDEALERRAFERIGGIPEVEDWEFTSYAHAYWYGLRHGYLLALRDEEQ